MVPAEDIMVKYTRQTWVLLAREFAQVFWWILNTIMTKLQVPGMDNYKAVYSIKHVNIVPLFAEALLRSKASA